MLIDKLDLMISVAGAAFGGASASPDFSQGGPQRTNSRNDPTRLPKIRPVDTFDTSSYSFFGNTWLRISGEPS